MTDDTSGSRQSHRSLTRRRALAAGGTLAAGGVGILALASAPTRADVSVEGLSIPDASFTAASVAPVVDVTVGYEFDVGEQAVSALEFALEVGETVVAESRLDTARTRYDGTTEMQAPLADADAWSASDFSVAVGESVTREVSVGVRFAVVDSSGVVVSDTARDTATVEVRHPQETEYVATVGGSGVIRTPE